MIPTNDLRAFAKYEFIRTFHPDGTERRATRIVTNEELPVCWDVVDTDPSWFKAPVLEIKELPSTSQMIKKAQEDGFGDWYPMPEDAEPDPKDYLVD